MSPKRQADFDFGPFKTVKRDAIPSVSKSGKISRLTIYKKLLEVINYIVEKGVTPFEEALEIDLDSPEVKAELKQLGIKSVGVSFLARVRKELKNHNIKNVDLIQRDKGKKLFLVGAE